MTTHSDPRPVATPLRNDFLDALRLVAAFGVVWIHSFGPDVLPPVKDLGRFAVPFFAVTSIWLMSRRPEPREPAGVAAGAWASFAGKRFVRLYVPFMVWNLFYTGLRYVKMKSLHRDASLDLGLGYFLAGISLQLWFLPFLLLAQCAARAVLVLATYGRPLRWALVGLCAAAAVASAEYQKPFDFWNLDYFTDVVRTGLPAACLATMVALTGLHRRAVGERGCWVALGLCGLATGLVVWHGRSYVVETLSGLALAVAALHPLRGPVARRLAPLGAYAFGIYLVHSGLLDVMRQLAPRLHLADTVALHVGMAVVAGLASLAFCVLFVRLPYGDVAGRWLGLKSH